VFSALEARIDVVIAQVPLLVGANRQTATRTDDVIAALDATGELSSTATMGRSDIVRWRAFRASRARSRSAFTIAADFRCSGGSGSITTYRSSSGRNGAECG
jgi:hypothetical protein